MLCSWIGRLNISKLLFLLNLIDRFNAIPIINPNKLLFRYSQTGSKVYMKRQRPRITYIALKKNKLEDSHYSILKLPIRISEQCGIGKRINI